MSLEKQLIKLGNDAPSLRAHIRPILAGMGKTARFMDVVDVVNLIQQKHMKSMQKDIEGLEDKIEKTMVAYGMDSPYVRVSKGYIGSTQNASLDMSFETEPMPESEMRGLLGDILSLSGGRLKSLRKTHETQKWEYSQELK